MPSPGCGDTDRCAADGTIYIPALNPIFKTEPFDLDELLLCLALSSLVFVAVEIEK